MKTTKPRCALPKWFMEKAYDDNHGITNQKKDYVCMIEIYTKSAKRKNIRPETRKMNLSFAKLEKRRLKEFEPVWFSVEDVKEFFRQILDKYELIEKGRMILRPRPQDIGKKHYHCKKCHNTWWTKKKPKKCGKCGNMDILPYYRM